MRERKKEPYAGSDFYKEAKHLVAVTIYLSEKTRAAYTAKARKLRKKGVKTSAQKLQAEVLTKNAPKK